MTGAPSPRESAGFARRLGNEEGELQTVRSNRPAVAPDRLCRDPVMRQLIGGRAVKISQVIYVLGRVLIDGNRQSRPEKRPVRRGAAAAVGCVAVKLPIRHKP